MMYAAQRSLGSTLGVWLGTSRATHTAAATRAIGERVAPIIVAVATVWFAVALSWGLFGRIAAGHDSVIAARGIVADNMLAWHIWGPVRQYTTEKPTPDLYYGHHPFGSFWLVAAFAKLLGRHAFVPRLVPVVMSTATPPLLYGVGRGLWGPLPGALAAATYAVLPITLAFGNFPGFEVPLVFGCLLATWGYLRYAERWEPRWLAVSLLGVAFATNSDWEANVFLGVVLVVLCVTALWAPTRWFRPVPVRSFMRWWGIAVGIMAVTLVAYAYNLIRAAGIDSIVTEAGKRARGNTTPLSYVLDMRRYWIDVTFTPVAIGFGKLATAVLAVRVLLLGRVLEIFPLAIGMMAAVQYLVFKNGADVHIYWPMPFAPYAALAVAAVAASVLEALPWFCRQIERERYLPLARVVVASLFMLVPLAILPDGVRALRYARVSGGRFNEKGKVIYRDLDKITALDWMASRMAPARWVSLVHDSMHPTWALDWALHRPLKKVDKVPIGPATSDERYFFADMRFLGPDDQKQIASSFHVVAIGPFLFVDRALPPAPIDGYSFVAREPTPLEWYFVSGTDPVRTVRPDPWYTWELRDHFGQSPNPRPQDAPRTTEDLRIAHNAALAAGDDERARDLQQRLVDRIRVSVAVPFNDGTQLLGEELIPGAAPVLALYFKAVGPARGEIQFRIDSQVVSRPAFSLVGADPATRQVNEPFPLPAKAWKRGYIYSLRNEIRQRPGAERFTGYFESPDRHGPGPQPANGIDSITLLDLK
jgi:hypothetical protein